MNSRELIKFSLRKTRVEKLIVLLGWRSSASQVLGRGAGSSLIGEVLLSNANPPKNDVHDPDRCRVPARSANGAARPYYRAYTQSISSPRRAAAGALRRPQQWDSSPVVDFGGLWCDRLLLGPVHAPSRTALFCPHVPPVFQSAMLERVAQGHPSLATSDVLLVDTTPALELGVLRLWTREEYFAAAPRWEDDEMSGALRNACGGVTLRSAMSRFAPSPGRDVSVMAMGCGSKDPPVRPFSNEENQFLREYVALLASFAASLWTANPDAAKRHLEAHTATPKSLSGLSPASKAKLGKLWGSMQTSMLSTRDTALLDAYFNNTRLDNRLSVMQQTYLATTLLRRLQERYDDEYEQ